MLHQVGKKINNKDIALIKNTFFLQEIIDAIPNPVFLKNTEGLFVACNRAFANYTGLEKDQIVGKTFYEIVPKELADRHQEMNNRLLQGAGVQTYESKLLTADGIEKVVVFINSIYLNSDGSVAGIVGIINDITEITQICSEFKTANRQFSSILDSISDGFVIFDHSLRVKYLNKEVFQIFLSVQTKKEVIGKRLEEIYPLVTDTIIHKNLKRALREQVDVHFEYFFEPLSRWYEVNIYPIQNGLLVHFRDVTERKKSEERIRLLAYYDQVTGLPNRVYFKDYVDQVIKNTASNQLMAVVLLDLDGFKLVNDTLGHDVGDELLKAVGDRLIKYVHEQSMVARMGDDEFAVLLPQINSKEDAEKIAEKILQILQPVITLEKHELYITASIGISVYPIDGMEAKKLIRKADAAMYCAKEKGRNNYQFYQSVMKYNAAQRLAMENGLRRALERQEFVLFYQPQIDVKSGKIIGAEALLRWKSPDFGMVSPLEFIPLAESTGLIVPIGRWVLRSACRQAKYWQEQGLNPVRISVNISARQLQQHDLVETIKEVLQETGLEPCWLELEITESQAMYNAQYIVNILGKLKELGIKIALDDFGTGYSSLVCLKYFPIDKMKIDKSLVQDIGSGDADNAAIVMAALAMAKSLKLKVLAEGVESKEQYRFMKEHGCDEMQGYLFSRPLPAVEFEKLLKKPLLITED